MSRLRTTRAAVALAAVLAVLASGCGDDQTRATDTASDTPTAAATGETPAGDWLLRFTTAGGADGERSRAVYVRYDPATGAAAARALPALTATDASQDEETLLVSADHAWALPDTGIAKDQQRSGKLVMYAIDSDATQTLDIKAITGKADLRAVAWAFDPEDARLLRVVDSDLGVWDVEIVAGSATKESTLQLEDGWIYGNGFDKATGEPYVESVDSDQTDPAGNGDSDVRPVARQGGTLIRYDGDALAGLPDPPCGFAGGFQYDGGVAWLFCADTPSITAYQAHPDGAGWQPVGTPSPHVVPASAAELTFALPPVG